MDNKEQKYINKQQHLSQYQLVRYNEGEMNDTEMHQVEMHLLSCDLCTDALEGIALMDYDTLAPAVQGLKERLSYRIGKSRKRDRSPIWRWAAIAAVLLLSSFAIMLILDTANVAEDSIVKKDAVKEEIPTPVANKPLKELETDTFMVQESMTVKEISPHKAKKEVQSSFLSYEINRTQIGRTDRQKTTAENRTVLPNFDIDGHSEAPETIALSNEEEIEESEVKSAKSADKIVEESLSGSTIGVRIGDSENAVEHRIISGKIFDNSGAPIPGANVILKGSTKGTVSDINGEYTLSLPKSDTALEISFIGFSTEEIFVNDTTKTLNTTLGSDMTALSEVVVTGYGTRNKRKITGAVSVEKPSTLARPLDGRRKFDKYIKQNLFTEEAEKIGVKGDIKVSFFIAENGTLSNIKIIDSIGYGLDEKAVQLLKDGPKWQSTSLQNKDALKQAFVLKIPVDIKKK